MMWSVVTLLITLLKEDLLMSFNQGVDALFWWCVEVLKIGGDLTGLGYNLLNILVFIILQPTLILIFFILWRVERKRRLNNAI